MIQFYRLGDFPFHSPPSLPSHCFPLYYYNRIVLQQQSHVQVSWQCKDTKIIESLAFYCQAIFHNFNRSPSFTPPFSSTKTTQPDCGNSASVFRIFQHIPLKQNAASNSYYKTPNPDEGVSGMEEMAGGSLRWHTWHSLQSQHSPAELPSLGHVLVLVLSPLLFSFDETVWDPPPFPSFEQCSPWLQTDSQHLKPRKSTWYDCKWPIEMSTANQKKCYELAPW